MSVIHPEKEGAKPARRQRCKTGRVHQGDPGRREAGTIEYPWQSQSDPAPRDKIAVFDHYPEWNRIVVTGSYSTSAHRTQPSHPAAD